MSHRTFTLTVLRIDGATMIRDNHNSLLDVASKVEQLCKRYNSTYVIKVSDEFGLIMTKFGESY